MEFGMQEHKNKEQNYLVCCSDNLQINQMSLFAQIVEKSNPLVTGIILNYRAQTFKILSFYGQFFKYMVRDYVLLQRRKINLLMTLTALKFLKMTSNYSEKVDCLFLSFGVLSSQDNNYSLFSFNIVFIYFAVP